MVLSRLLVGNVRLSVIGKRMSERCIAETLHWSSGAGDGESPARRTWPDYVPWLIFG